MQKENVGGVRSKEQIWKEHNFQMHVGSSANHVCILLYSLVSSFFVAFVEECICYPKHLTVAKMKI